MAGTDGTLNITELETARVRAWLYFFRSTFAKAGIELTTSPEQVEDDTTIVHYTLHGSRASFVHRLDQVGNATASFVGAMAVLDHSLLDQSPVDTCIQTPTYIQNVAAPILASCRDAIDHGNAFLKVIRGAGHIVEDATVFMPLVLSQAEGRDDLPAFWSNVISSCHIVISLLHNRLSDPTLAVIIIDRACEIALKRCLRIRKARFPLLKERAIRDLGLPKDIAANIEATHKERNTAQHEGTEIEFQDAVRHARNGFQALEWLYKDDEAKRFAL